jgi:hypothetical protein
MQISFHEWEDSPVAHRAAASLGSKEVQVWIATAPSDEAGLTALACQLSPDERAQNDSASANRAANSCLAAPCYGSSWERV